MSVLEQLKADLQSKDPKIKTAAYLNMYSLIATENWTAIQVQGLQTIAYQRFISEQKFRRQVRKWLMIKYSDTQNEEDILNEAIVILDKALLLQVFKGASNIDTYFLAICWRLIASGNRRISRVRMTHTPTIDDDKNTSKVKRVTVSGTIETDFANETADIQSVADRLILEEVTDAEAQVLAQMPKELNAISTTCRDYLRQYYYEKLKMKQIAELNELANADRAKSEMARCREMLRKHLQKNSLFQKLKHLLE